MPTYLSATTKETLNDAADGYTCLMACYELADELVAEYDMEGDALESGLITVVRDLLVKEASSIGTMRWWLDTNKFRDMVNDDERALETASVVLCLEDRDVGLGQALLEADVSSCDNRTSECMAELRSLIV